MSEIENLEFIHRFELDAFIEYEQNRWQSDKGTFCVHDGKRY